MKALGLVIDGIAASEAIDTSGEELAIKGVDISSLTTTGVLNYEHRKDTDAGASANDIIGKIIFAKKIFSKKDCEDKRQEKYWNKVKLPFIYIVAELFDDEKHPGAIAAAAMIRYYKKRSMEIVARFSIEGSTLKRDGNKLLQSVARRVALTIKPCNVSCETDVLMDPANTTAESTVDDTKKHEAVFTSPDKIVLGGCDIDMDECIVSVDPMEKALTAGDFSGAPSARIDSAALVPESPNENIKKAFVKFITEWDGNGDVKELLKTLLPTASDDFLDHFERVAEDYRVKRNVLRKGEEQPIIFGGNSVIPGLLRLLSRTGDPSGEMPIIGMDDDYVFIQNTDTGQNQKISRAYEGSAYQIVQAPIIRKLRTSVVGDQHVSDLNWYPEQEEICKQFDTDGKKPFMWHKGRVVTCQEQANLHSMNGFDEFVSQDLRTFDDVRRQVAFYNIGRYIFGAAEYIPMVAVYKHPDSNQLELLAVHDTTAQYPECDLVGDKNVASQNHNFSQHLHDLGMSGVLDKLAIMDIVLGMGNRNDLQYVFSGDGKIKLINNNLSFEKHVSKIPSYIYRFYQLSHPDVEKDTLDSAKLHPDAIEMLARIEPAHFIQNLAKMGVPHNVIARCVLSLNTAKKMVALRPTYHSLKVWVPNA